MGAILEGAEALYSTWWGPLIGAFVLFCAYKWFKWMADDSEIDAREAKAAEEAAAAEAAATPESNNEQSENASNES